MSWVGSAGVEAVEGGEWHRVESDHRVTQGARAYWLVAIYRHSLMIITHTYSDSIKLSYTYIQSACW